MLAWNVRSRAVPVICQPHTAPSSLYKVRIVQGAETKTLCTWDPFLAVILGRGLPGLVVVGDLRKVQVAENGSDSFNIFSSVARLGALKSQMNLLSGLLPIIFL